MLSGLRSIGLDSALVVIGHACIRFHGMDCDGLCHRRFSGEEESAIFARVSPVGIVDRAGALLRSGPPPEKSTIGRWKRLDSVGRPSFSSLGCLAVRASH